MVRFRLERGPVPLHHQVYLDLRGALEAVEWPAGDRLPTERELAARYGCSLITVRRALDDLAREGRLERIRGRGTFATRPPIVRDIAARAGFADEMRARGLEPFATVVTARQEPATLGVAGALGMATGSAVHHLERVRGADGIPLLLEQAYLSADRFPGLLEEDYATASLYEVLEGRFGCRVVRTRETISAVLPDPRESRLLGLRGREPALCLEGSAFSGEDEPIEHSRTIVSSERGRYYVETSGSRTRTVEPIPGPGESPERRPIAAGR